MSKSLNIDDEWKQFMNNKYDDESSEEEDDIENNVLSMEDSDEYLSANLKSDLLSSEVPKCSEIYISTKTKIAYLNQIIDLKKIFWSIPVIPYANPTNGVVKKQMKFNLENQEELDLAWAEHYFSRGGSDNSASFDEVPDWFIYEYGTDRGEDIEP